MNLTKQINARKNAVFFFFLVLSGFANFTFAQTVSGSCHGNCSGFTSTFQDCGSNVFKGSYTESAWNSGRVQITINGTVAASLGYTASTGCSKSCWTPCVWESSSSSGASSTLEYIEVNTSAQTIKFTTTDFACSAATAPTLSTTAISSITCSTASSGGNTISDGGASITAKGVCWSTSTGPTTADDKTSDGTGTAVFASSITGLTAGTTYYVRAYATNSEGTSYGNEVSFTATALPTITGSNGNSRCGTGTMTIDATASAGSIEWYDASSGGSNVGSSSSGASWTTPSIASTTTYYAEATNGSCLSAARTAVTATVNANPTITGSTNGSRCNNGTVEIQATTSGGNVDWYAASSGGSSLGSSSSGVNWTTPSITATTTYYAEANDGTCTSASRTAVTATKNVASTGPGGVTDELHVWLKADAGVGSIGTSWEDQSCNGFDYTTVAGPSVESGWNYNSVIEILSGGFDAPAGAELGTDWTVFFVSAMLASDNNGRLIDGHSGDYLLGYQGGYRNGINMSGSPSEYNTGIATTSGIEEPHVFTYVRESSGSTIDARVDGDLLKTFTSTNSGSGIRLDINQGANSSESSDSWIGEFIIFNKELSDAEIQKVEAYLGSKYAVAMSDADGGTGGDYISTGGTTYWDASANSTHNTDIVVIGKDANTGLTQKQSKSQDDSLIVFISSLASDNASNAGTITNDESFITIGHNGGALLSNSSVNAERPAGIETRFAREWKLTNTNFDDNFSIEVEWDSTGAFDINDVRLLVDDDGDFSNASVYSSSDGITFSIGSIIVGGLGTTIFPKGLSKFFTLASANAATPLPVELLYFDAKALGDKVQLSWETMAEINNDYFIVEKSADGKVWEQIMEVPGVGNTTEQTYYTRIDMDGCNGNCYYRLTQVDFDGTQEVFKAINFGDSQKRSLTMTVRPNPVVGDAEILFTAPQSGSYNFSVMSQNGQMIYQSQVVGAEGYNSFSFPTGDLPKGLYHFIMNDESGNMIQQKIVK